MIYKQFYDTIALKNVKPFASNLSIKKITNKGGTWTCRTPDLKEPKITVAHGNVERLIKK